MHDREVLTFAGTRPGFFEAFDRLRAILDRRDLPAGPRYWCELVFEEVVSNIIRHGYVDDRPHEVSVTLEQRGNDLELQFEDDGVPFDPREPVASPVDHPRDSDGGGRGLHLLRSVATDIEYERTPEERNRLTVRITDSADRHSPE